MNQFIPLQHRKIAYAHNFQRPTKRFDCIIIKLKYPISFFRYFVDQELLSYSKMFDYFKAERAELVKGLSHFSVDDFTRNRELSFYSIKDVFLHTIDVEDRWLHYLYPKVAYPGFHPENFKSLGDVEQYMSQVDIKTKILFDGIKEDDLRKEVRRKYPDGTESIYTLEQVLYHIPIEVIHHYGEIFAEFWKMNLDAPYLSYLRFLSHGG